MSSPTTADRDARIRELAAAGTPYREIAEAEGLSLARVEGVVNERLTPAQIKARAKEAEAAALAPAKAALDAYLAKPGPAELANATEAVKLYRWARGVPVKHAGFIWTVDGYGELIKLKAARGIKG